MTQTIPPPGTETADRAGYYAVLGLAFLAMYGALVVVPWSFLVLRLSSVAGWMVFVAVALAGLVVAWVVPPADRIRRVAAALTLVVATLVIGGVVAHNFYDSSFDGQTYHTDAIIAFSEGWNPFEDPHPGQFGYGNTAQNFPKASWLAASSLYTLTDSIEVGKSINLLPLGGSFLLALALLTRLGVQPRVAWAGSALAAINPVWVVQSLTNYIDGQTAALLLGAVAAGLWILLFERTPVASWSLGLSLLLLVNLKFTGLYYVGLILFALTVVLLWQRRWNDFARFFVTQGAVLVVAVGVIGFNPYVQNLIDFDTPFYPIVGPGSIDFFTPNSPENLRDAPQLTQLVYGVFGAPGNPIDARAELIWPFGADLTVTWPYTGADARIAGLGPWFGGALLVSVALGAWLLWKDRRQWRGRPLLVGALSVFLILSWMLHDEGWWARYTPQLWLVPVAVAIAAWSRPDRLSRWLGGLLVVILSLNVAYIAAIYYHDEVEFTHEVAELYEGFTGAGQEMPVSIERFRSAAENQFEEAGVTYREYALEELPCQQPVRLPGGAGSYCPVAGS